MNRKIVEAGSGAIDGAVGVIVAPMVGAAPALPPEPVDPSAPATPVGDGGPGIGLALTGALLTMILAALDQNIVNTALPRIVGDLGGMAHLSWVITAFMLTSTVTTALYGKLSDLFGRRALIFVAVGLFLVGSLLCGSARSMGALIVFRGLQGLGAGGLLVLAQSIIADVIAPRDRPRYQGLFTGTFALASVVGPVLGGAITQMASWRWVFYINLPIGLIAVVMIAIALPRSPDRETAPIDWLGATLLTGATTSFLLLLAWGGVEFPWASAASAGLVGATVALAGLFLVQERRAVDPLIRLALFKNVVFARGVAVGGMMVFAMMGSTVFLPLYFQLVLGMLPATAGAMLLPQVVGMVATSFIGGRLVAQRGRNRPFLLAGIGLEAVALASLAVFAWFGASPLVFLVSMALLGLGMGMGMPNITVAVQNAVDHHEIGAATGAMTFARSLGGALGVAASGTIMALRLAGSFDHIGGIDIADLTSRGVEALATLTAVQQTMVADVYRAALTGCFLLSTVVMSVAFVLVLGMPDRLLRGSIAAD